MTANASNAASEAPSTAYKMGSTAADIISFMARSGEEIPAMKPALRALKIIRATTETATSNREELAALGRWCTYMCDRQGQAESKLAEGGHSPRGSHGGHWGVR